MRRRTPSDASGFTAVELAAVLIVVVLLVLLLLPALRRTRDARWQATCAQNLKSLGLAFRMYSYESANGLYPPMHGPEPFGVAANATGCTGVQDDFDFAPDLEVLCPDYIEFEAVSGDGDPRKSILVCAAQQDVRTDNPIGLVGDDGGGDCTHTGLVTNGDVSYFYLPWVVREVSSCSVHNRELPAIGPETARLHGLATYGPPQLVALAEHLRRVRKLDSLTAREALRADLDVAAIFKALGEPYVTAGHNASSVVEHLGQGVERYLNLEPTPKKPYCEYVAESEIPVLFDRFFVDPWTPLHRKPGANFLFMDGHVEFVAFPGKFPVTDEFARILRVIEE